MGIKGKDFVVVVGDTSATQQIITIKHDEDKLVPIDSHKLMCLSGTNYLVLRAYANDRTKLYATCSTSPCFWSK